MKPEEWQRVKEIFDTALSRDVADRAAFLDAACGDDPVLRRRVEELLNSDQTGRDLLSGGAGAVAAAIGFGQTTESRTTRRLGPYQILREIGHGGMGRVYLAERADGHFRKQVAVKLVNPRRDAEDILRRFRNERQVLADLDHPNIARLVDGGVTEDALPYLVMDYVDGERIDAWCDNRKIGARARLKLFQSVCAAVQYAHDRRVIHRDIKPANILVTADGTAKLLDFGIAKVLNPEAAGQTGETTHGPGPMTPEYASPEQVRGETVTAATDIYSIGAVLYELLTGRRARSSEPSSPSAVVKGLDGDLDNIVMKAMRSDPDRRYASVRELSEDIGRFLHSLPVRARKESIAYRGRKFVKRNRALITAMALSAVTAAGLVLGLGRITSRGRTTAVSSKAVTSKKDTRWDHLKFEKLAALGDPAPGGGVYTKYFQPWGFNSHGDVTFVSEVADDGGEAIFLLKKAGLGIALARPGQTAPAGGIFAGAGFGYTRVNDGGDVAFTCSLKPLNPPELKGFDRSGLYFYSQTDRKLSAIVIPGVTPAPGFGVFQSTGATTGVNNAGEIVFLGVVKTKAGVWPGHGLGQGIFLVDRNRQIVKVVAPGDPAPGGSTFDDVSNPWVNDQGDIAFEAHLAGDECTNSEPMGCWATRVYIKRAGAGPFEPVAHMGEQAPDAFRYFITWGPILNNRSDVLFIGGQRAGPNAIYLHSRGVTAHIAGVADIMPDGRKIVTVNPAGMIGNYSHNNRGDISFIASLENRESALYVQSQGEKHLIAGTGSVIPGIGTVASLNNFRVNGGVLNDSGQIFFWAMTTDQKGVLLLATPLLATPQSASHR